LDRFLASLYKSLISNILIKRLLKRNFLFYFCIINLLKYLANQV